MTRALALAVTLTACAASPRLVARPDPAALAGAAGRTPVTFRSAGPTQNLSVAPEGVEVEQRMEVLPWCQTPCTLHLPPGEHRIYAGAPAVLEAVTPLRVGASALTVRVLAPDRARWERGRNLLVGAVGLAALGVVFLAMSPLEVEGGSPTGVQTIVVGAALTVGGAALGWFGLRAMRAERAGLEIAP